jgi:hypothetical protein
MSYTVAGIGSGSKASGDIEIARRRTQTTNMLTKVELLIDVCRMMHEVILYGSWVEVLKSLDLGPQPNQNGAI